MNDASSGCDVVVVGAGFAGLAAADALSRDGAAVVVLEARNRVGGRAHSTSAGTGMVDLGATWFWPDEPLTRSLAEHLGVPPYPQHLAGDAVFESDHTGRRRLDGNPIDVPSFRFVGGAQSLAERLADRLPPGTVRLDEPVSAVAAAPDGVRVDARSGSLRARHVILALPPALAVEQIKITPGLPDDLCLTAAATAVWMGGTVKAVAVYDHTFWRGEQLSGSAISHTGPFREFHDHSGPGGSPAAIFGFAMAEDFKGAQATSVGKAFTAQLERLFGPGAGQPRQTHVCDWSRERYTVPQHPSAFASAASFGAPVLRQPIHDRIHLASTETASAYAGHIEGALRSGAEAAVQVRRLARG